MDIAVHTGTTRHAPGTILASLSFSAGDEHACLLLHVDGDQRAGKTLEQEAASILQHSLLGSEGESWNRLDGALKELNGLFKGLLLSKSLQDVHAVVALLDREGALHVSHAGRGEAYLVRGGVASQITEFTKGKPVAAFIHISSGQLEDGDAVILSTQRLLRAVTPAQLTEYARRGEGFLEHVQKSLEGEKEEAALAALTAGVPGADLPAKAAPASDARPRASALPQRQRSRRAPALSFSLAGVADVALHYAKQAGSSLRDLGTKAAPALATAGGKAGTQFEAVKEKLDTLVSDLKHPQRKRRAHLFILAGVLSAFLVIWLVVSLFTSTQRSKTRAELSALVQQIEADISTANNRWIARDADSANTILARAEEYAKQVMNNESRLFRVEAVDLLDKIRQKREEINNISRVSPRLVVNLSSNTPTVSAQGLIGLGDGEFVAYDRQNTFRVLLNKVDDPNKIVEDDLILQGANFPRFKTQVFMTTGNSMIEGTANQFTAMKTEDPAGWITGKDIETYLRFLYVLSPDRKQIYKYERLSNRYSAPAPYNVNGDLTGAIDMTVDGAVYVLKEGGTVLKLFRGETQPFALKHAPEDALATATKVFKVPEKNFYFLDPEKNRVIVATDGGESGESSYLRQYILEGEQLGSLVDLYVDPDESHLYVLDEKRLYVVDLAAR